MNVVEYSKDIQVILGKYIGIVVNAIRELMGMNLMTEKRFTIKSQDDLFGVVDNYSPDKIYVLLMVFVLKSKQNGYVM